MIHFNEHRKWMDVEKFAASHGKDWTYVIFGQTGPTGKTYLYNQLLKNGYNVIEIAEDINLFVEYHSDENHYFIYYNNKCVVIVLNRVLDVQKLING